MTRLTHRLGIRLATEDDISAIVRVVNAAYRRDLADSAWTTEAHLVAGPRADGQSVALLISRVGSLILVAECERALVATVHLERVAHAEVHLGMLAVDPTCQAGGIGSALLRAAECHACRSWGTTRITIDVISLRSELMEFYQRRGYRPTGTVMAFPANAGVGVPITSNLHLAQMEKHLDAKAIQSARI